MVNIQVTGISGIINRIERRKRTLEDKVKELIEKAAEYGYKSASVNFQTAIYAGTNDVRVIEPSWEENTLILAAEGKAVAFIEFGTGVHYTEVYPISVEGIAPRGTYGKGKGSNDSWVYVGDPGNTWVEGEIIATKKDGRYVVKTHGNPPARAMYNAGEIMKEKITELAKEVFSTW